MSGYHNRFQRCVRLTTTTEFRRVFAQPQKLLDRYFTVLTRPNELSHPRLGLAISKKSAKSAVQRNRIKRLIRESFRLWQQDLPELDIVVIARSGLVRQSNATLFDALAAHWRKLGSQLK